MSASIRLAIAGLLCLSTTSLATPPPSPTLIVVEDRGGASALPYYRALNLKPRSSGAHDASPVLRAPPSPTRPYREADLLPIRSHRLTPGDVIPRVVDLPGLTPLFLIGEDVRSRTWLNERIGTLRQLRAIGIVVEIGSEEALAALRRLAPDLTLIPSSGDDLAQRLGIAHYPVLITPTGIEP